MVLLISYDLNGHERPAAYAKVKALIEKASISCIKPLYSQWFVETNDSPEVWTDYLTKNGAIDANDCLFVVRVTAPYQGWLTTPDWTWLNRRV